MDVATTLTARDYKGLATNRWREWLKLNEIIEAVAVEEQPIDRAYNAKGQERQTHLEVMGALLMRFAADMLQECLR